MDHLLGSTRRRPRRPPAAEIHLLDMVEAALAVLHGIAGLLLGLGCPLNLLPVSDLGVQSAPTSYMMVTIHGKHIKPKSCIVETLLTANKYVCFSKG